MPRCRLSTQSACKPGLARLGWTRPAGTRSNVLTRVQLAAAVAHADASYKAKASNNGSLGGGSDPDPALQYFSARVDDVNKSFPGVLSMDDFIMRTEMALGSHNFRADNAMAMCNVCRDEATGIFKSRLEKAFGPAFNMNGLGACLTCGCLGMKAGMSHGPNLDGRERYIFFSFPHVAVAPSRGDGGLGTVNRPGREGDSTACGALAATLGAFQADSAAMQKYVEGAHDASDPELSILMQRLAARISRESLDVSKMTLSDMTQVAERAITADLEAMIHETVDPAKTDYAVVTGIQVHNWALDETAEPSLEFIAPRSFYVVNNGRRVDIDIDSLPALSPRQLALLRNRKSTGDVGVAARTGNTTVVESKQFATAQPRPAHSD